MYMNTLCKRAYMLHTMTRRKTAECAGRVNGCCNSEKQIHRCTDCEELRRDIVNLALMSTPLDTKIKASIASQTVVIYDAQSQKYEITTPIYT